MSSSSNLEERKDTVAGTENGEGTEETGKSLSMVQIAEMLSGLVKMVDPVSKKQREVLFNSLVGLYGLKVVHKDAFVTRKPHASGFEAAGNTKSGRPSNNGTKSSKHSKGGGNSTPKKATFDKKNPEWVKLQEVIQGKSDKIASAQKDSPERAALAAARKADVEKAKVLKKRLQKEQTEKSGGSK